MNKSKIFCIVILLAVFYLFLPQIYRSYVKINKLNNEKKMILEKIQFYIGVGFFQSLRRKNCNFLFRLPFLFHLPGDIRILHARHIGSKLLHIAFQCVLIHFFGKIVMPVELRQILHSDSKHLLKGCLLGKVGVSDFIVYRVYNAD